MMRMEQRPAAVSGSARGLARGDEHTESLVTRQLHTRSEMQSNQQSPLM